MSQESAGHSGGVMVVQREGVTYNTGQGARGQGQSNSTGPRPRGGCWGLLGL